LAHCLCRSPSIPCFAGSLALCAVWSCRAASGVSDITLISLSCLYRLRRSPPLSPKLGAER
jgi:hypothetical protein